VRLAAARIEADVEREVQQPLVQIEPGLVGSEHQQDEVRLLLVLARQVEVPRRQVDEELARRLGGRVADAFPDRVQLRDVAADDRHRVAGDRGGFARAVGAHIATFRVGPVVEIEQVDQELAEPSS
jgi:hypothetical protein